MQLRLLTLKCRKFYLDSMDWSPDVPTLILMFALFGLWSMALTVHQYLQSHAKNSKQKCTEDQSPLAEVGNDGPKQSSPYESIVVTANGAAHLTTCGTLAMADLSSIKMHKMCKIRKGKLSKNA